MQTLPMRHFMILAGSVMTLVTFSQIEALAETEPNHCEDIDNSPYIGTATMSGDGTISLSLIACDPQTGARGHGFISYAPAHPDYQIILDHLGGISAGERKGVPPFSQDEDGL